MILSSLLYTYWPVITLLHEVAIQILTKSKNILLGYLSFNYWAVGILYISWIPTRLSDLCFMNIFSMSVASLFVFLMVSFVSRSFQFWWSWICQFFMVIAFCDLKKFCSCSESQRYSPLFFSEAMQFLLYFSLTHTDLAFR